jgi:hypothetical protein
MRCLQSSKRQYCERMTKGEAKEAREEHLSPYMLERPSSSVGIRLLRQNTSLSNIPAPRCTRGMDSIALDARS